jgi:glucosylceramidase
MDQTLQILLTSEQGHRLSELSNTPFQTGRAAGNVVTVDPEQKKQSLLGIGTSFTEASAFVLAHLDQDKRGEVMARVFSEQGANFPIARTHIGACDFCVHGRYSYADQPGDSSLDAFDISVDLDGFDSAFHPGINDPSFDLLPMIQQALAIKQGQGEKTLRIMASAWTAPAWMKDIEDWYRPPVAENDFEGTGGRLKPEYESTFADYLVKYLESYRQQGVDIWAITPLNEPLGNSGQWESMLFTPETQNAFIRQHLGPALANSDNGAVKLYIYDHSRDQLEEWADAIYGDSETAEYVAGAAVHWYESSYKVFEDVFDRVHDQYPQFDIIHSEGCIDDLGKPAPEGVLDPDRYQESGWFANDDFWWNDNATDWAYTVTWPGVNAEEHPIYTPVHRYARNIIVSLDHWVSGWIDWNIVLDKNGGPNHVGNFCGAPIMVDTDTGYVYYTPIYFVLAQFSRTIRPGDRMVETTLALDDDVSDQVYSCSSISPAGVIATQFLNTCKQQIKVNYQIGQQFAELVLPANSLLTVRVSCREKSI